MSHAARLHGRSVTQELVWVLNNHLPPDAGAGIGGVSASYVGASLRQTYPAFSLPGYTGTMAVAPINVLSQLPTGVNEVFSSKK